MAALEREGVHCVGFDAADAALERCRRKGLTAHKLVIGEDPPPADRADVVVSTEVAEHVPESAGQVLVEIMTSVAPAAVFTAAMPGSSGRGHVNEQPNEYWIARFAERGFAYDSELGTRLRAEWRSAGVDEAFFTSLMIFRADPGQTSSSGNSR